MNQTTVAPVPILRGRRDAHDIEIVLRFDPRSPIARTEVEVESEEHLASAEYLAVVADAAARLALYAGDYKAAMADDQGDQGGDAGERRPAARRVTPRRHGLRLPCRGTWSLQEHQDGRLALLDPTGQPVVIASHAASQERLRRLFGRMMTRASSPY